MPTRVDDLKPGMFVALTGLHLARRNSWTGEEQPTMFDGTPLEVLEVSLPFIAVRDQNKIFALDNRICDVQKVSRRYADLMADTPAAARAKQPRANCRKKKAKRDERECPRCGGPMVQRCMFEAEGRAWHYICKNCDLNAGPVPK